MYICDFETVVKTFEGTLPKHAYDLIIRHNSHTFYAQSMREYMSDESNFHDVELNGACEVAGSLWEITWFPEATNMHKHVYGPTLLDAMRRLPH